MITVHNSSMLRALWTVIVYLGSVITVREPRLSQNAKRGRTYAGTEGFEVGRKIGCQERTLTGRVKTPADACELMHFNLQARIRNIRCPAQATRTVGRSAAIFGN